MAVGSGRVMGAAISGFEHGQDRSRAIEEQKRQQAIEDERMGMVRTQFEQGQEEREYEVAGRERLDQLRQAATLWARDPLTTAPLVQAVNQFLPEGAEVSDLTPAGDGQYVGTFMVDGQPQRQIMSRDEIGTWVMAMSDPKGPFAALAPRRREIKTGKPDDVVYAETPEGGVEVIGQLPGRTRVDSANAVYYRMPQGGIRAANPRDIETVNSILSEGGIPYTGGTGKPSVREAWDLDTGESLGVVRAMPDGSVLNAQDSALDPSKISLTIPRRGAVSQGDRIQAELDTFEAGVARIEELLEKQDRGEVDLGAIASIKTFLQDATTIFSDFASKVTITRELVGTLEGAVTAAKSMVGADAHSEFFNPNLSELQLLENSLATMLAQADYPGSGRVPVENIRLARQSVKLTGLRSEQAVVTRMNELLRRFREEVQSRRARLQNVGSRPSAIPGFEDDQQLSPQELEELRYRMEVMGSNPEALGGARNLYEDSP